MRTAPVAVVLSCHALVKEQQVSLTVWEVEALGVEASCDEDLAVIHTRGLLLI